MNQPALVKPMLLKWIRLNMKERITEIQMRAYTEWVRSTMKDVYECQDMTVDDFREYVRRQLAYWLEAEEVGA